MKFTLSVALAAALFCTAPLAAQGSQAAIGGGCPNRSTPTVSGSLTIGTTARVDDIGCFAGQSGFGVLFFGSRLPASQWVTVTLSASITGAQPCDVVLLPAIGVPVGASGALAVPIPNNPALQGAQVSLQAFCNECGFAGCFDVLTQGLEITIG